ncbi:MAG: phytanoyl-CoA dioxygenase family protein [Armatimonadetes bacterium]|nr:phytanoyl-CoA dioxygenase family protein [Armatimonadota bacterium]
MSLSQEQIEFFNENSYLRLEKVFSSVEVQALDDELSFIMDNFAITNQGWTGPWRKVYLQDEDADRKAQLTHIHELHHYSQAWTRAAMNRNLVEALADLIGPEVELHHSTLHAKTGGGGMPFPMHQDYPFYPHENGQYLDAIVHVDTTDENNGCLKFLAGSHKLGPLEHITQNSSPHLPTERYRIQDAVSCPAASGDVVLFSIHTIHGSAVNHSPLIRRVVRLGFRNPRNRQVGGQAMGRPGIMVNGLRPAVEGMEWNVYGNWTPPPA